MEFPEIVEHRLRQGIDLILGQSVSRTLRGHGVIRRLFERRCFRRLDLFRRQFLEDLGLTDFRLFRRKPIEDFHNSTPHSRPIIPISNTSAGLTEDTIPGLEAMSSAAADRR